MNLLHNNKVKMIVLDMAGTTVNEGGIIYKTLFNTLKSFNYDVKENDIKSWHGLNKYHVLDRYINKRDYCKTCNKNKYQKRKNDVYKTFEGNLKLEYFYENNIKLIDGTLPETLNKIRSKNIKVALNTGYPRDIQETIIDKLNMSEFIDSYISSEDVEFSRPYPFMIFKLMEMHKIESPSQVIKVGDTTNDILEGKNACCYKSIGVLSGAESKEDLIEAGAHLILDNAIQLIE